MEEKRRRERGRREEEGRGRGEEERRRWRRKGCRERKAQKRKVVEELLSLSFFLHPVPQERRRQRLKWKFTLYFRSLEKGDRVLREDFCPRVCL